MKTEDKPTIELIGKILGARKSGLTVEDITARLPKGTNVSCTRQALYRMQHSGSARKVKEAGAKVVWFVAKA